MIRFAFHAGFGLAVAGLCAAALGQVTFVGHNPSSQASGEPSGTTERSPLVVREDQAVTLFFQTGPSSPGTVVWVYYTIDGTDPVGTNGVAGSSSTRVMRSQNNLPNQPPVQISFVRNVSNGFGGFNDLWRASLPPFENSEYQRRFGQTIKYRVSSLSTGGVENFAGGGLGTVFSYTNKLAWPGSGNGSGFDPSAGYPTLHFWKEEGVVGNNWINSMIDQNATWFDIYYPGAGGVWGVGTKNEGYVNGLDTFPPGLPLDNRGQMHLNQAMVGIRYTGTTYWTSNRNGTDFVNIEQTYLPGTNTVRTTSTLASANLNITQWDFAPKNVTNGPEAEVNNLVVKRMRISNPDSFAKTINVYLYMDPAINGGDNFDAMFVDAARGTMVAYDNVGRTVNNTGPIGAGQEYNPTTGGSFPKQVSVYLAGAMRVATATGAGTPAADSWRDTSGDNGQGWIGKQVTIGANASTWVDFTIVGGFDNFAGATGTYNAQMAQTVDWFINANLDSALTTTNTYWSNFLASGVTVDTPDNNIDSLFERGLLATMLHFDARNGGLIAGFRNGAYPYVWPRDMAWAGVTLARTGHNATVDRMTDYLRDITFRDFETWTPGNTPNVEAAGGSPFFGTRKGFWKQKYSTDGYVIWGAPQVDETAVIPWMIKYNYDVTGDVAYLTEAQVGNPANTNYAIVKDAAIAMSQTSKVDGTRLNHRPSHPGSSALLMYSNNIWEDQYDTFIFSNANIVRGLRDAASIATTLGNAGDAADFTNRANGIMAGLNAKLDWDGENTDISLLGIVYPFATHSPTDPRAVRVIDRINGVARRFNGGESFSRPLVRFANEYINNSSDYVGLIDRYYGDSYWGNSANGPTPAGPWFLSTMWYGMYYALRQDSTPGTADIDNHLFRLTRTAAQNGPLGLGAEQMAPSNSLQYPGQSDFKLQTAWPNAWESMSFYVDSVMGFLGYEPDAVSRTLRITPRLPGSWNTMTFNNMRVADQRVNVTVTRAAGYSEHVLTKTTTGALSYDTTVRLPAAGSPCLVYVNGVLATGHVSNSAVGSVKVTGSFSSAPGTTVIRVYDRSPADVGSQGGVLGGDGALDNNDFAAFITAFFANNPVADVGGQGGVVGGDGAFDNNDFAAFITLFFQGCP